MKWFFQKYAGLVSKVTLLNKVTLTSQFKPASQVINLDLLTYISCGFSDMYISCRFSDMYICIYHVDLVFN